MIYSIVTLEELKEWLKISGSSHDTFLKSLQQAVTEVVERYCGHRFITRRWIEDLDVINPQQQEITVGEYPIYVNSIGDNFKLYNNPLREFTNTYLVKSDDYVIDKDIGQVKMVSGYLLRGVGAVRVDYWAGVSRFKIVSNENDTLKFRRGTTEYTATVSAYEYNAEDLASALQSAMATADTGNTYTVTYSHSKRKFTISGTSTFDVLGTGTINETIGFPNADSTGLISYESSTEVTGIPDDIRLACQQIVMRWFDWSGQGKSQQELEQEMIQQGGTRRLARIPLPLGVAEILDKYRRWL